MKKIALLFAVGFSCFLSGVIVTSLWFRSRVVPPTSSAQETGTEPAWDESRPGGDGATTTGNNKARAARFAVLDTDGDGKLSLNEFGVGRSPTEASKWFSRRDGDQDGFISKQEFLPVSAGSEPR